MAHWIKGFLHNPDNLHFDVQILRAEAHTCNLSTGDETEIRESLGTHRPVAETVSSESRPCLNKPRWNIKRKLPASIPGLLLLQAKLLVHM